MLYPPVTPVVAVVTIVNTDLKAMGNLREIELLAVDLENCLATAGTMPWRKAFASAIRFKSLKSELVYQPDVQTQAMAKQATFDYIDVWYNRQRRHSAFGFLPPFDYYQQVAERFVQCFFASSFVP